MRKSEVQGGECSPQGHPASASRAGIQTQWHLILNEACSLVTPQVLGLIHEDRGKHHHLKATGEPEEEIILLATNMTFEATSAHSGKQAQAQLTFLTPWCARLTALAVLGQNRDCSPARPGRRQQAPHLGWNSAGVVTGPSSPGLRRQRSGRKGRKKQ